MILPKGELIMSKLQKILFVVGASLLTLLVLSNSFCIYQLIKSDNNASEQAFYNWEMRRRALLRYTPDSGVDPEHTKELVTLILKDEPTILRDEPIILISNPDLKLLVAEILEEEPSILEEDPLILYKYPEFMDINPELKPILEDILENTDDPYVKTVFSCTDII